MWVNRYRGVCSLYLATDIWAWQFASINSLPRPRRRCRACNIFFQSLHDMGDRHSKVHLVGGHATVEGGKAKSSEIANKLRRKLSIVSGGHTRIILIDPAKKNIYRYFHGLSGWSVGRNPLSLNREHQRFPLALHMASLDNNLLLLT